MVLGEVKVVILHCASQPCSVMCPASLRTVELGKSDSSHCRGMPGVGAKRAEISDGLRPPSLSASERRKRSTKKR